MSMFSDRDIFGCVRPWTDFSHDLLMGDEWVASAKCYHYAELVADEIATARLVEQPAVVCDAELANTDECCTCAPLCAACRTEAAARLYLDACPSCGDVFKWSPWKPVCRACREAGEVPPAMARAALGLAA